MRPLIHLVLPILVITTLAACSTVPGREVPLREIAVSRARNIFTGRTKCRAVKLYKIKRVDGTQAERIFFFRLGGCHTAMDFIVRCEKWSHSCPEGRMLTTIATKPGVDSDRLFETLPLTTRQ